MPQSNSINPLLRKRRRNSGQAIVEASLMVPWILFLFVGIFDFGFYAYALIATQNAARVAVLQTSVSTSSAANSALACAAALAEMKSVPNVTTVTTCAAGAPSAAFPVAATAALINGGTADPSSRVTITYLTLPFVPIPGLLNGQFTITRVAEMRLGS